MMRRWVLAACWIVDFGGTLPLNQAQNACAEGIQVLTAYMLLYLHVL